VFSGWVRGSGGGLVVAGGVEDQLAEQLAGGGVCRRAFLRTAPVGRRILADGTTIETINGCGKEWGMVSSVVLGVGELVAAVLLAGTGLFAVMAAGVCGGLG
jgi:hypothetical protein